MLIKINKKLKKIINKNYKVKAFLSLEVVFIIGILGFFTHKITNMVYVWIKKFYLFNSILITVNSYIQIPIPINKSIDKIQIISNEENTLKITSKNIKELKPIYKFLQENVPQKELITFNENEITIENKNNNILED